MSSDPTPPDPDTLTADPQTGGTGGTESATGGDHPVVEGLLSTEPSEEAETPAEMALRGTKKFIRGALGAGVTSGQTAAEDFLRAAIGYYRQRDSGTQTSDGPQTVEDELAGDIDRQAGDPVDPQGSPYNPNQ